MGPSFFGQVSHKRCVATNSSPQLPLPCLFVGRSLGGHDFDGIWVRAVPSALLMGPFVCRESELKTFKWRPTRLLNSRWLVLLPITHSAGMTLTGFRSEPFHGRS